MFKINITAFNNGANLMVMKDILPEYNILSNTSLGGWENVPKNTNY